jgi:hypothetical protein
MRLNRIESRNQFYDWLQRRHPRVMDRVMGFGYGTLADATPAAAAPDAPWYETLAVGLSKAAPNLITAKAQYDLIKVNMKRSQQGLPPIDSASVAPTVRVQTDLPPEVKQTNTIIKWAVGGVGVLGALKLLGVL